MEAVPPSSPYRLAVSLIDCHSERSEESHNFILLVLLKVHDIIFAAIKISEPGEEKCSWRWQIMIYSCIYLIKSDHNSFF